MTSPVVSVIDTIVLLKVLRADDNEAVIRNRLAVYEEQTAPLINYYREKNLLVSVEAHGSVEAITERIEAVLA